MSCVELPNPRLGNMKGAWTHGAMMTHIRTFVCYFSRLKSLVLPAVGSTNPILRPRIQKPQAMVKHWWNTRGLPPLRTRSDGDRYLWVYKGKKTHLFGCVKKSGKIEGSKFSMHLQRKDFSSRSQRKLQVQSMFFDVFRGYYLTSSDCTKVKVVLCIRLRQVC